MVQRWQRDASETRLLYAGFPSKVRKYIGRDGARHSLTDKLSRLVLRSWTQVLVQRAKRIRILELVLRCELLPLHKTSVTRRMYARGPTRKSDLSYE